MMKIAMIICMTLMSLMAQGQSYTSLWKQAETAEKNDLPRSQYDVLMRIVKKAQKEGQYGQLMAAELAGSRVMATVSPDSLQPAVDRIDARRRQCSDKTAATIYALVLKKIYDDNGHLEKGQIPAITLDAETCNRLAAVKAADYKPLTIEGRDSRWFNDDMLSVVGYELKDFQSLNRYYQQSDNRVAAMITALEQAKQQRTVQSKYIKTLDSLTALYGDLPEAGELAIERYYTLPDGDEHVAQRWQFTEDALQRWGSYQRTNVLRNIQRELICPRFQTCMDERMVMPDAQPVMKCQRLTNISALALRIYRTKLQGNTTINLSDNSDLKQLRQQIGEPVWQTVRQYSGKRPYDIFEDSIQLPQLSAGVYMIEVESTPKTEISRRLYFVSGLRMISETLPGNRIRFVIVDACTGKPVKDASVQLSGHVRGNDNQVLTTLKTNAQGEAVYSYVRNRPYGVYVYTDTDKACMKHIGLDNFYYNARQRHMERTQLFTDRSIYRPGQTVRVAAVCYEVDNGFEQKALAGKRMTLTLRDANHKAIAEKQVETDRYGSCAADFTLPVNGLTGLFSVVAQNGSCGFRVEEYKRPTFEVTFDDYTAHYQSGDTVLVRGFARSYAGVPVQGAKVRYMVERRRSYWWWAEIANQQMAEGEAVTDVDGAFTVAMPMVLPESDEPLFFNFVCKADVTDQGGETHQGQIILPLGNRPTAFSMDLNEQMRMDRMEKLTFHQRNAAGKDIDTSVRYRIDKGKWLKAKTNIAVELPRQKSGRHMVEAICGTDTLKRSFVVFGLDDKRPATETDDWFYVSDTQFPNDGTPVTVQVGSSAQDVHIVYSIISGDSVVESGAVDRSNELLNRQLSYKPEFGNGLLLTFAWVKNGRFYRHETTIRRPLPDKRLKMSWKTFRNCLTPGQQEEWTLTVTTPDGKPADALLMATLYDKSLDQITRHHWDFTPYQYLPLPNTRWNSLNIGHLNFSGSQRLNPLAVSYLDFSHLDESLFPQRWMTYKRQRLIIGARPTAMATAAEGAVFDSYEQLSVSNDEALQGMIGGLTIEEKAAEADEAVSDVPLRENLQETAFFYSQLQTDADGQVVMKFTLPESVTTWRFMSLAHTPDLCYGQLEDEAVAKKDLMVQPNMPRFIREGDKATIAARIINTSEQLQSGKAVLTLTDPETEKIILKQEVPFSVKAGETGRVLFPVEGLTAASSLLIARITAASDTFSDGEQHYLVVLSNQERVTVTVPFTQHGPGTKQIDLKKLIPQAVKDARLTVEYTNHPEWLLIQALPAVGHPHDDCAVCQAAALYANQIGKQLIDGMPEARQVIAQWQQEKGQETSLQSELQKNEELRDLVLDETPWVSDAERETEQRQRITDFLDANMMQQRLTSATAKLQKLQGADGAWSWWPDMPGSTMMTTAVTEMLVRMHVMTGTSDEDVQQMINKALHFLGQKMVERVAQMKADEKKGHRQSFPGGEALQWLYICRLDGRQLPSDVEQANRYLKKLLKKEKRSQTIYQKAMTAIILGDASYIKSLKEYTVYQEEMGRYYDTPRAGYSWRDYRIPTQVAAIEAIQRLTPADEQTIEEMRRWLLQEKRTQAWDNALNSVDAVWAFCKTHGPNGAVKPNHTTLALDGQPLQLPQATAGLGYVKTAQPYHGEQTFSAAKTSEGTSWGALYAQFMQPVSEITDQHSGISVKRELLGGNHVKVGDRVTIRLTITSERDLDFVQLQDRRAACMEPLQQLSGYNWLGGYYMTPRDQVTNYYFDRLSKGKHVIETTYYIDRAGQYETGTCTVQCAYAPAYRGLTESQKIIVNNE